MAINPSVFKAYDIRGVYGKELQDSLAYAIGRAFVSHLKCNNVVVGRDARKSSPALFEQLVKGLTEQGANVVDIGECTTPMFYFAVGFYGYEAGIMITASHNPAEYNGFKLTREGAIPIAEGSGMEEIKEIVIKGGFQPSAKRGRTNKREIISDYARYTLSRCGNIGKIKVVADAGNGMATLDVPVVFEGLPVKLIPLFFERDLSFPNHEANPMKQETLKPLQNAVIKHKAALGVAFDGDSDRVGFVDDLGRVVPGDIAIALISTAFLEQHPGSPIVFDHRCSWSVGESISQKGGIPIVTRVGNPFVKQRMRESGAWFGGESSGHLIFRESFFSENSVLACLKMMELLTTSRKPLSMLVDSINKYHKTEEINLKAVNPKRVMEGLKGAYKGGRISEIDGLKIEMGDFWLLIRLSNTEPLMRLIIEAKSPEVLEKEKQEILKLIDAYNR